jgi:hypothetical protein
MGQDRSRFVAKRYAYVPAVERLRGRWRSRFATLSSSQQDLVLDFRLSVEWDQLDPRGRREQARMFDIRTDPGREYATLWEVHSLLADVEDWIGNARESRDDARAVVLGDVRDRLQRIVNDRDRAAVGVEIRDLREATRRRDGPWPWGSYETKSLDALAAAAARFWANYDPSDPTTAVTNAAVVEWLAREHGVANRTAGVMATILRADGLPTGPRGG